MESQNAYRLNRTHACDFTVDTRFRGFSEDWAIAFIHNIRLVLFVCLFVLSRIFKCYLITNQHIDIVFVKASQSETEVGPLRFCIIYLLFKSFFKKFGSVTCTFLIWSFFKEQKCIKCIWTYSLHIIAQIEVLYFN